MASNTMGRYSHNTNPFAPDAPEVVESDIEEKIPGSRTDAILPIADNSDQTLRTKESDEERHDQNDNAFGTFRPLQRLPSTDDPPLPLNSRDVAAFIVNKMIGTGIFTTPATVLLLTRSKGEAIGLWILSFVYVLISMAIYLEFARRLPHTGGELIYLDESFPNPRLLLHTLYSFYFIVTYSTATNSMQFANQVLSSANVPYPEGFEPDSRLLRFIAVVILTFFCLLHYFSARVGRALNQVLAFIKIGLLLIVIFAASQDGENATFVSGEIETNKILRKGFISAVWIVGTLYVLVNVVFLLAVPYDTLDQIRGSKKYTEYAALFFGGGAKATRTWHILTALSASGSLLSVVYTCARVKEVIGKSNVIPWSRTWAASSPAVKDSESTPMGGLLLHWIFCVLLIIISSRIGNLSEGLSFPGSFQAYGSGFVGILISLGLLLLFMKNKHISLGGGRSLLNPRSIPPPTARDWDPRPASDPNPTATRSWFFRFAFGRVVFSLAYLAINIYMVVVPVIPPYVDGYGTPLKVQGWWYLVIAASIVLAACVYYIATIGLTGSGGSSGYHPKRSILKYAGVEPRMCEAEQHDERYGFRRMVEITIAEEHTKPSYLYWFFGGSQTRHYPSSKLMTLWNHLMGR